MARIDGVSVTGATYCLMATNMLEVLPISSISNLSAEIYFTFGTTDLTNSPTFGENVAVQTISCLGDGNNEIIFLKSSIQMLEGSILIYPS